MCIVFTCGEHTFRKEVEGYEGFICQCYNCGNMSGSVIKSHPWFTFCFIVSRLFNSYPPHLVPGATVRPPAGYPDLRPRAALTACIA
jgi:hypothetical protein